MGSRRREPGTLTLPAPVALYVHFPFCISVCPYCDFVVFGGRAARGPDNRVAALVDAVVTEIELRGRAALIRSVYIGGGTPSLMTAEQVAHVLDAADRSFGIAAGAEITLEVNPGAGDRGDVAGFAAAGVNRISIGAQSLIAAELRQLGRRHSAEDVGATVVAARAAGVRSVSIDLLYDVPGQTIASWRASLDGTLELEPDHVSAYALTLDEHEPSDDHLVPSAGATRWRSRARAAQDEDRAAQMYELADDLLARAGLDWYEISNWARAGHTSRHNNVYWTGAAWEAVGPGAHAYDGFATRRWNAANLERYISTLAVRALPPGDEVAATDAQADAERAILRLRTVAGLPAPVAEQPEFRSAVSFGLANALLERTGGGVRLTRRGRLLSNEVFARLLPERKEAVA
jgi:oxygen-independent coproporphyrinogen-3 oxidase